MAPNTPPGRPGTLTPEQEIKLREFWAVTLKVFGVVESTGAGANGAETPAVATPAPSETSEKEGKKDKEKKKSRLNVFKRNKGEKGGEAESTSASGASTPTADVGSLSIADEDDKHGQVKEAKLALANTSPEDLRTAFWAMLKHDHPDALLLRFLRARKWDVEKALVMMISTMHWRLELMHVDDDIMKNGEEAALKDSKSDDPKVKKEGEDFLAQLRMGKSFLHGLDNEGRPLCVARARMHRAGEQSEASLERFTVYTIETARMLLRPPIDTATIVFDMTDFSMANMDYTPVKFMIKCFEANYPESLGNVLVYKAPWIFNAIWNIIRGWLDPVVAGKVHFAKNVEELEKFIPKSQIIAELGGDDKWTYEYVEPKEGENAKMAETGAKETLQGERSELVKKYEESVTQWVKDTEQTKSMDDKRKERDAIAEELRLNYWKLDPYVRAKSLYDRTGVLGESGQLNFYPTKEAAAAVPQKENVAPAKSTQETSADDID
ncbi:CRAL/TRIO domain-containing protein [Periconia macrospinosa]|uniref:CRAL/TRIO domain-containing protein n=1 Tax=Periconia macrospinosa TaxID=97972 RepID=A0A2V1DES9_9PLEO|nr:CRAL/TRIO domain-containing protein [Periconia macrospinosa]